jgi:hypothetical protein
VASAIINSCGNSKRYTDDQRSPASPDRGARGHGHSRAEARLLSLAYSFEHAPHVRRRPRSRRRCLPSGNSRGRRRRNAGCFLAPSAASRCRPAISSVCSIRRPMQRGSRRQHGRQCLGAERDEMRTSGLINFYEEEGCVVRRGKRQGEPMKPLTKQGREPSSGGAPASALTAGAGPAQSSYRRQ